MTSANMKLVSLRVPVADAKALEQLPKQSLESGEFIVRRVVRLDRLNQELKGMILAIRLGSLIQHFVQTMRTESVRYLRCWDLLTDCRLRGSSLTQN